VPETEETEAEEGRELSVSTGPETTELIEIVAVSEEDDEAEGAEDEDEEEAVVEVEEEAVL
jgi:hypothetical protein